MLEHSLRWYCVALCRAVLKETDAKSNPSKRHHLRRGSSFGGHTRRRRCSSAAGAASHAPLFSTIRTLACHRFPVLCDVLRNCAPCAQHWACVALRGFCARADGLCSYSRTCFGVCCSSGRRDLRASFIAFVPYSMLVAALVILLARTYPLGCYLAFVLLHLSYPCYSMGLSFMAT